MNNRIMPKWSEVKDVNGINLHLFDAVQVITSGNKRNNQTGRIIALLKTKPYLQMVEVLFKDGKRSNFLTSSLRLVESSEDEKGKALAKIDSLKLMGAEITDSDFCVDRYNNDAFLLARYRGQPVHHLRIRGRRKGRLGEGGGGRRSLYESRIPVDAFLADWRGTGSSGES